jgi:hypothetical protein
MKDTGSGQKILYTVGFRKKKKLKRTCLRRSKKNNEMTTETNIYDEK